MIHLYGKELISVKDALEGRYLNKKISVAGWVRTRRDSKAGISFVELSDGSCLKPLQLIVPQTLSNYREDVPKLHPGASVFVTGVLVPSPAKGQAYELQVEEFQILGLSDPLSYPIQKKRHSFEFLREHPHLRPRTNTFGAVFRVRSRLAYEIHRFFQERGFFYINTPIITANDCEGAGELFRVTGNIGAQEEEFFGRPSYLTVSGQLELEAYALALSKVYTFGPTFRAENSNTTRHLSEFWMVEPEVAFLELEGNIQLAEEFIKGLVSFALEELEEELEFFQRWVAEGLISQLEELTKKEFVVLTYQKAIEILKESKEPFQYPVFWGADLKTEHERYITEKYVRGPVVVVDYPKEIKPFYMKLNPDGRTVRAMDLLLPKWGEIIGGSQREDDYDTLLSRMKELHMDTEAYWWYLDLRRYGSVPHSGFGLGFERMLLYITGLTNIRDVIPYPRSPKNLVV